MQGAKGVNARVGDNTGTVAPVPRGCEKTGVLSVTRVRVKDVRLLPRFVHGFAASVAQLRSHPLVWAAEIRWEPARVFWTVSLWPSLEAMASYRNRNPHRTWMGQVEELCDESAYLHRPADAIPPWPEIEAEFARLAHRTAFAPGLGSTNHSAGRIPVRRLGVVRVVRPCAGPGAKPSPSAPGLPGR